MIVGRMRTYRGGPSFPIPIWSGILEHRKQIGQAFWTYAWLLDKITREVNGVGFVLDGRAIKTQELARDLERNERSVRRDFRRLQRGGFVLVERRCDGFVIRVLRSAKFSAWRSKAQEAGSAGTERPATSTGSTFEAFWNSYPRKVAKPNALRAWAKVATEEIPLLMSALEEQKGSAQWKRQGGRFIPYPASWLNARRWEDQREEVASDARQRTQRNLAAAGLAVQSVQ